MVFSLLQLSFLKVCSNSGRPVQWEWARQCYCCSSTGWIQAEASEPAAGKPCLMLYLLLFLLQSSETKVALLGPPPVDPVVPAHKAATSASNVRPPSISTRGGGSGASGLGQKGQSSGTHTLTGFHRASHLFGLTNYEIVASQHRSWLLIPLSTTNTILFQDNTVT